MLWSTLASFMCRHDELDGPWLGLALSMHFVGRRLVVEGECQSLSLLATALSWLLLEVDVEWRSFALLDVDGAP